jgi:hypothetical protein
LLSRLIMSCLHSTMLCNPQTVRPRNKRSLVVLEEPELKRNLIGI